MYKIQPKQKAIEKLFEFSKSKGYVSFNDILDVIDFFHLTIDEVDGVSEQLLALGCVIKEIDEPTLQVKFDIQESELNIKSNAKVNRINEKTINKKKVSDEIVVQSIKDNKIIGSLNEEELFDKIMELFDKNRLLEAIEYCDIGIDGYPDIGQWYYQKAAILIDLEKYQEALELCDIALEKFYIKEHCYCTKAIILEHLNKYDESVEFYNKALKINPENICALINLSAIMSKLGDTSKYIEYLKRVIEIEPTNIECMNDLAVAYHNMDDFEQADLYYDMIINLDPKYSNAYYNKALIVEAKGDEDRALNLYSKAIENDNQNTDAYYAKGQILRKKNMNTEALKYYMKVINLDSEYIEAYKSAAEIFLDKNNYEYALANYNKAIVINPNDANCYLNKGICLGNLKKYSDAEDCFRKSIILDSKEQLNYFHMAYVLDARRKYEEAISYYNKAITLKPDDMVAYNNKGYTLFKMKKYEEAIKCYDKALEIDPEYKLSIVNKKNALKKLKQETHDFDATDNNENIINNESNYLNKDLADCNNINNMESIEKESKKVQRIYFYILKLYKNQYFIDCRKELSKFFNLNNNLINDMKLSQKYTIVFILISFGELDLALKQFNEELLDVSSCYENNLINKIRKGDINNIQEYVNNEKIHYTFQDRYTINLILENICDYYYGQFPSKNFYEATKEFKKDYHQKNINEYHIEELSNSSEKNYVDDKNYEYEKFIKKLVEVFRIRNIDDIKNELKLLNKKTIFCKRMIEENKLKDYIIESLIFNIDDIILENEYFSNYIKNNRCNEALLYNIYKEAINTEIFEEVKYIPNMIFNENKDKFLINDSLTYTKVNRLLNQEYIISQSCLYLIDEDMICKEDNRITNKTTTFIECLKNNEIVYIKVEVYICILCEKRYVKISAINRIREKGYIIKTKII